MGQPQSTGCMDDSFGPWAGPDCRGGFDFTLLFEESILSILLQCIFLICVPFRLLYLAREDVKIMPGYMRPLKELFSFILASFNMVLIVYWATTDSDSITHTRASLATAILTFVGSVVVCFLSGFEHSRSFQPSLLLSIYLYLSILADLPRMRTIWMLGAPDIIPAIFTCTFALRIILSILESMGKRNLLVPDHKHRTPDVTRSILSGVTFAWVMPLFAAGFKRILVLEDLFPLEESLRSGPLQEALVDGWEKVPDKTAAGALFSTWFSVFPKTVYACVLPRLGMTAFTYAQPFLINRAVEFAALPKGMPYDNYGYGLIGAFALAYGGLAISIGRYQWRSRRMSVVVRGSLIGLIYKHALLLDLNAPDTSPEAILTLASNDTDTVALSLYMVHEIWASIIEISVADYLIYRQMGAACAMPIAAAILMLVGIGFIAAPTGRAQAAWMAAIQQRVTKTSKVLGNIKWIKMLGLSDVAFSAVRELRVRELAISLKTRLLLAGTMIMLTFAPIWTPILTFSLYAGFAARGDSSVTVATVFTSYSVITLMVGPLTTIMMALPQLAGAVACFQRIQDFLNTKRKVDNRESSSNWSTAFGDLGSELTLNLTTMPAITLPGLPDSDEYAQTYELDTKPLATSRMDFKTPTIASVQGTYRYAEDRDPVIDIAEFNVPRDTQTFVLGPVGCGKSTLLKALLGELSAFDGTICANFSGVAYCDQVSWIPNDTVRNIITGRGEFDESWYRKVLGVCELERDLAIWPEGENTVTGAKGLTMSGGQKQRMTLARALYSRKDFLILDDIFSGLDASTKHLIFQNLWGTGGILREGRTTTVVACSDESILPYADQVVVMNEKGRIMTAGPRDEVSPILRYSFSGGELCTTPTDEDTQVPDAQAPAVKEKRVDTVLESLKTEFTDQTRRLGDWDMYRVYITAAGPFTIFFFTLALAVNAFCGSFPTIWLGWWATAVADDPTTSPGKWLGVYVVLGVGSVLGAAVGLWELLVVIINKCGIVFHDSLVNVVSKAPLSFFTSVDVGTTLNRFSEDMRFIDMELPVAAYGVATTIASLLAQLIIVGYTSKYLAASFPILLLFLFSIQHIYLRTSRQLRLLDIEQKAPVNTQLLELLDGLVSIRAYQWEDRFVEKSLAVLDDSQRPNYLLGCVQCWLSYTIDMILAVIAIVFIVITSVLRDQTGTVNMGIGLNSVLGLTGSAKTFVTFWVMLEVALGAVSRVSRFAKATESETLPHQESIHTDSSWPAKGAVEVRELVASYPSSGTCLDKVSFSVRPGEKVAVCGRTGSGKSSLALCLLRMLELDSGSIVIDGMDLGQLPADYVRSRLVASTQEPYIMDDTIRFNLDPFRAVPDTDIIAALDRVNMWSKVESMGGLDGVIDEKSFSLGESQLFVLVRAMLRHSKVLILDEFSSSLDQKTTEVLRQLVRDWFAGWTVISITHDLDSLVDYDRVVLLEHGTLVGYGEPEELMETDAMRRLFQERG